MPKKRSDATDGVAVTPESDVSPGDPWEPRTGSTPAAPEDAPATAAEPDAPPPPDPPEQAAQPVPAEPAAAEPGQVPEPDPAREPEPAPVPEPEQMRAPEAAPEAEPLPEPVPAPESPLMREPEPAPEPEPELHASGEVHDEHHEEEAGRSFAARALTFLLILIAGAAIGIWGAPKLAPLLPAGLAPVAAWLAPGLQESAARLADLEARLDAGLGGLDSRLEGVATSGDVENRIAAAVAALDGRLSGEIGALQEAVGQLDGADTRQRLARLESALDGQAAEVAALKEQLAGATGAASEQTQAEIDVYRAELEGLRAEMGALSDQVQGLGGRIDEVEAEADRQIEAARSQVATAETELGQAGVAADLALVRAAIFAGVPFEEPLERIASQPGVAVPEGLTAAASSGVLTLAALRDSFPDAAHTAIRASILAGAGDGLIARGRAFLEAQVASRSLTPRPGVGPDAVLSRMEDRLRKDDLDGALTEAAALPSEAAGAMDGWLAAARLRAGAVAGLAALEGALAATN